MLTKTVSKNDGLNIKQEAIPMLIQTATQYQCKVYCVHEGIRANAKSLLGMISFMTEDMDFIEVVTDGEDEEIALSSLVNILCNA